MRDSNPDPKNTMTQYIQPYFRTFTVTVASPGVFTSSGHELREGDAVILETTGALPTGLSVDTVYYVIRNGLTTDTFQLSTTDPTTLGITDTRTAINTSGSQSGVHSWMKVNRPRVSVKIENLR